MFSMNSPPAPPSNPDFAGVVALLNAIQDPASHGARLKEQAAATQESLAAKADAIAAFEKLQVETKSSLDKIATEKAAAQAEIERQRVKLGVDAAAVSERSASVDKQAAQLAARTEALDLREARIAARESHLRHAADAIAG